MDSDGLRLSQNFKMERLKASICIFFIQCILFILFVGVGVYDLTADASNMQNSISPIFGGFNHERFNVVSRFHGMFQDIHVMIFIGFGFLMVFLRKYGYSSVGFNFLLAALILQWSILCQGFFFDLNEHYKIEIGLISLYKADIATAVVLISMGVVLGRTSHIQLVVMGILEIAAYCLNVFVNDRFVKAVDIGGSVLIHTFGAYFGLAVSYVLGRQHRTSQVTDSNEASYTSNIATMIGTIFLWVYWPSFNAIGLEADKGHRAIINTYLSLTSSCVLAFVTSQFSSKDHKFDMVHIQNSSLAGGVAVGACAHLMLQPFGAILLGMVAGGVSVYTYRYASPLLEKFNISDTCGVHNLHGLPGVLGGITGIIMAALASEDQYGKTLYEVYPARSSPIVSYRPEFIPLEPGDGRSAAQQAEYQALLIVATIVIAGVSGLVTGYIINLNLWSNVTPDQYYQDSTFWTNPNVTINMDNSPPTKWKLKDRFFSERVINNSISKISS